MDKIFCFTSISQILIANIHLNALPAYCLQYARLFLEVPVMVVLKDPPIHLANRARRRWAQLANSAKGPMRLKTGPWKWTRAVICKNKFQSNYGEHKTENWFIRTLMTAVAENAITSKHQKKVRARWPRESRGCIINLLNTTQALI